MDHRDMAEDTVDIHLHLFLAKILDQFHIAVSDSIHEGVPVVGCGELVDEMWKGIEEVDDLFGIALFLIV